MDKIDVYKVMKRTLNKDIPALFLYKRLLEVGQLNGKSPSCKRGHKELKISFTEGIRNQRLRKIIFNVKLIMTN